MLIRLSKHINKQKLFGPYPLIAVSLFVLLNIIGVSYAAWSSSLDIKATVQTGNLDPVFCNNFYFEDVKGTGNLQVRLDDKYNMYIQGEVEPGYSGTLNFFLKNEGTIPGVFFGHRQPDHDGNIKRDDNCSNSVYNYDNGIINNGDIGLINGGMKLKLENSSETLKHQEILMDEEKMQKLRLNADKEGVYNFEIELVFGQKKLISGEHGIWEKKVVIRGSISVCKPKPEPKSKPKK